MVGPCIGQGKTCQSTKSEGIEMMNPTCSSWRPPGGVVKKRKQNQKCHHLFHQGQSQRRARSTSLWKMLAFLVILLCDLECALGQTERPVTASASSDIKATIDTLVSVDLKKVDIRPEGSSLSERNVIIKETLKTPIHITKKQDQALPTEELITSLTTEQSRQPKAVPRLGPDPFSASFGRRIISQTLSDPPPAAIIAQNKPSMVEQEPVRASNVRKRNFAPLAPGTGDSAKLDDGILNRPTFTRKKPRIHMGPRGQDQGPRDLITSDSSHDPVEVNKAVIRVVSTVAPRPITETETVASPSTSEAPSFKRTVIRRPLLRLSGINSNLTQDDGDAEPATSTLSTTSLTPTESSSTLTTTTSTLETSTEQVGDKLKTRMRIQDSLLARVQGKFRIRSTTPNPSAPKEVKESAVKNDIRLLRRNRVRNASKRLVTTSSPSEVETTASVLSRSSPSTSRPTTSTGGKEDLTTATAHQTSTLSSTLIREPKRKTVIVRKGLPSRATTVRTLTTPDTSLEPDAATEDATIPTTSTTTTTSTTSTTTTTTESTTTSEYATSSTLPNLFANAREPQSATTETPNSSAVNEPSTTPLIKQNVQRTDGLRKELMEAIKRKISQRKSTATTTTLAPTKTSSGLLSDEDSSSVSNNDVISTERPPLFRPVFLGGKESPLGKPNSPPNPRVQFFLRVPGGKGNPNRKIPHISHIQGKLARLNAAITEGLQTQRKQLESQRRLKESGSTDAATTEPSPSFGLSKLTPVSSTVAPQSNQNKATIVSTLAAKGPSQRPTIVSRTAAPTSSSTTTTTTTFSTTSSTTTTTTTSTTTASKSTTSTVLPSTSSTFTSQSTTTSASTFFYIPQTTPKRSTETSLRASSIATTTVVELALPEHPTSHFRPKNDTSSLNSGKADLGKRPAYGNSQDRDHLLRSRNLSEIETVAENPAEGVIHDISGTTVYVVAVICVIPAAGLVAWIVRYAVRKKEMSSRGESGSETGLNCTISPSEDDLLQIGNNGYRGGSGSGSGNNSLGGLRLELEPDTSETISQMDHSEISELLCNSPWQFKRQNLRLQTVLGEGNFGKVWKAEADSICGYEGTILVAVKTAKEGAPQKEVTDLLQEMRIMQQIGPHPNVVAMLGVCVEQEPYLLIMEYVMYGKLLQHLREARSRQTNFFQFSEGDARGDDDDDDAKLTAKDLTKYAYGVVKGMEFIVSKGIIHRDLAARNILIDHNRVCKISDFGLSRNLSDTGSEMYEQKTKGALPIRWMAPESLYFSVFTPKSDVWSFGILMWEIVTLGSTPYPGMGAREVMRKVRDGYRLERPSHCHPDLYKIISKCWSGDMNKRPDFSELRQELAKLLEDQHGYIDLQNIPEHKYYSMTQNSNEEEKL